MVDPSQILNILVLGASQSGKSSLILQYVHSFFPEEYDANIEDTYTKRIAIKSTAIAINLFDAADTGEYSEMRNQRIDNADGIILVYSVCSKNSLDRLHQLYEDITRHRDFLPPIAIAGTKIDLEGEREIDGIIGEKLSKEINSSFMEVSAKGNINVNEFFTDFAIKVYEDKINKINVKENEKKLKQQQSQPQLKMNQNFSNTNSSYNEPDHDNPREKNYNNLDNQEEPKLDKGGCCIIM
ncbi:P-loop containing nucleoside triphosphate hydrolase protein [Ascoidea rubescens DSM 1968]|uniref:p-loop containing nucleoside triphosphate hydrolase protein n=1 Tax=Ascoidea rubescens DSM 1968 TaxID=1344418 RepID=A0A1D2VQJ0_9ASCO|nr:P-loop containing nucleoside triphosphate hydrolase protein [Ascoidea rubescens DSM 1968]ODV63873.1 P-loop containing nucleoside triphosphate hydrolase protein [Ascoidea rubescens DSM 1968]